jgi:hypothetical protein
VRGVRVLHIKNLEIVKARMPSGTILNAAMRKENYTNKVLSNEDAEVFNSMYNTTSFIKFIRQMCEDSSTKYDASQLMIKPGYDHHPSELSHQLWAEEIYKTNQHIFTL